MAVELISETINKMVRNALSEVHTAIPAKIQKYDYKTHKAEVKPVIRRKLASGEILEIPVITGVPVMFQRSDNFIMHYPIKQGDYVLLIFAERSLDNWLSDGVENAPDDIRRFHISDAIAIPGIAPFKDSSQSEDNTNFQLKFKNSSLKITPLGETTIDNGKSKIKIDALGRIAIGNNLAELLQLFDLMLDALLSDTVITPPTKALLTAIKTALLLIKGSV